jgi:hypothetical protein
MTPIEQEAHERAIALGREAARRIRAEHGLATPTDDFATLVTLEAILGRAES